MGMAERRRKLAVLQLHCAMWTSVMENTDEHVLRLMDAAVREQLGCSYVRLKGKLPCLD
jgi:hypothetical protein